MDISEIKHGLSKQPHRRKNLLTGEWVLVSPHRLERPWDGRHEATAREDNEAYDAECYLCPGNERANGKRTPKYEETFVFDNDYSALASDAPRIIVGEDDLLIAASERGVCRVVCFSPRHDLSIAELADEKLANVVELWTEQYRELSAKPEINSVIIFENRGELVGCSNQHPHGQIWATSSIPLGLAQEIGNIVSYKNEKGSCLLCDYLELELKRQERIVTENEYFVTLVPFWASWPYETLVLPRGHTGQLTEMSDEARSALADIIKRTTTRYDNLFKVVFPYVMGMHQSASPDFHFHVHYFPPLLRSATVRKFMIGYEMLAEPQRDFTPEYAAEVLKSLPEKHYKEK